MDALKEWAYAGVRHCNHCGRDFAVLTEEGDEPTFCPFCASLDIEHAHTQND